MKVVAVTGGIGSGKSRVTAEFKKLGAEVIDADKIGHLIMEPNMPAYYEIIKKFGSDILTDDLHIDRKKLGKIVFSHKDKLEALNEITHKSIYCEIKRRIDQSDKEIVCVEIPLLFNEECPLDLDMIIGVLADKDIRIDRILKRDKTTKEEAEGRIKSQLPDEVIKSKSDVVLYNNGDIDHLNVQIKRLFAELIN